MYPLVRELAAADTPFRVPVAACTEVASGWSYTLCSNALTHPQELFGVTPIRLAA